MVDWKSLPAFLAVARAGSLRGAAELLDGTHATVRRQVEGLHPGIKRFVNPHEYPVGLSAELHDLTTRLTLQARGLEGP